MEAVNMTFEQVMEVVEDREVKTTLDMRKPEKVGLRWEALADVTKMRSLSGMYRIIDLRT